MCLLAILFRHVPGCPVVVAANREEFYDRSGTPPELWPGEPALVAGRDPRGGGTWLGVNEHGLLAAVTNRPKRTIPAEPRSRGLLCRDLLSCRSARDASAKADIELERGRYAGCNVLAADAREAFVVHAGDVLESRPLPPGIHVLTAHDVNDHSDRRTARARDWLAARSRLTLDDWLEVLPRLCGDHGDDAVAPICLHASNRGTVSSSIVALPDHLAAARWLHAQGPPCVTPFSDCSTLVRSLFAFGP